MEQTLQFQRLGEQLAVTEHLQGGGKKPEEFTQDEQRLLTNLRKRAGTNPAILTYLNGLLLHAEGRHEEAPGELAKTREVQIPNRPSLFSTMGEAYLALRQWSRAQDCFEQALAIDPVNPTPRLGLCRCHLARRRNRKALEEAKAALGLIFHNPQGHFLCGVALHRLGRLQDVVRALETAIAQNPVFPAAHRRLAWIHEKRLNNPDQGAEHRRLAREAQQRIADFKAGKAPGKFRVYEQVIRTAFYGRMMKRALVTGGSVGAGSATGMPG